jgi:ssDNA-specific exonuclease RecJ
MADALCRASGKSAREAQVAIRVFEELGFVGISDSGAKLVEDAPQRRLEESGVFTALNSIAERNEHYMRLYKEAHYGS